MRRQPGAHTPAGGPPRAPFSPRASCSAPGTRSGLTRSSRPLLTLHTERHDTHKAFVFSLTPRACPKAKGNGGGTELGGKLVLDAST